MYLTISYISNVSETLTQEGVETVMMETKMNNNSLDIRGILICVDQTFFQIIEGECDSIRSLYKKIEEDDRHYNLIKILETKTEKRRYKRFNSNYITYNNDSANIELIKFLETNIEDMTDKKLHDLIVYQSKILLNRY